MKLRFIVNARSGCAAKTLPHVQAFAASRSARVEITQRPGHGSELAAKAVADGCELVVAVGGDGTMNEVASALIGTGTTLGLVPCGSGDGLGRFLRIHGTVERALRILEHGAPRLIDTGTADGHRFFTAAGIGFEAEIAWRFNQLSRRGFARYITTSARLLREWRAEPYTVSSDAGSERIEAFTLAVANADQYGNNARIAPGARVDDGALNLTAVPRVTALNALPLLFRLFSGSITDAPGIFARRGSRFVVQRSRPGWLHTDGELHQAGTTVEFAVVPSSLSVMCPGAGSFGPP